MTILLFKKKKKKKKKDIIDKNLLKIYHSILSFLRIQLNIVTL